MWNGKCEVLADRECTFVQINHRLAAQGRGPASRIVPPKDFSKHLKPGSVDMRHLRPKLPKGSAAAGAPAEIVGGSCDSVDRGGSR